MILLLLGEFALDLGPLVLAFRISLADDVGISPILLDDGVGALALPFELLVVLIGVIAIVRRHLLRLLVNQ